MTKIKPILVAGTQEHQTSDLGTSILGDSVWLTNPTQSSKASKFQASSFHKLHVKRLMEPAITMWFTWQFLKHVIRWHHQASACAKHACQEVDEELIQTIHQERSPWYVSSPCLSALWKMTSADEGVQSLVCEVYWFLGLASVVC